MVCNLVQEGQYKYTRDLLALDSAQPFTPMPLPEPLSIVTTPPHSIQVADISCQVPRPYVCLLPHYQVLQGLPHWRSERRYTSTTCSNITHIRNMHSAAEHPDVIDAYLMAVRHANWVLGPITCNIPISVSPFGIIPKKHQPNKWRLILDLSSPAGHSVNDHIPESHCSIKYSGLEEAITLLTEVGHGAWMAIVDLKNAYRIVPIHPDDRTLLGMQWSNKVYLDICLPFGLQSAPKIFSAVADALLWIMMQQGVIKAIHYLDDFLIIGESYTDCHSQLEHALSTCNGLQ